MTPRLPAKRPVLLNSPFQPSVAPTAEKFSVDDRLTHDRHGLGRVVAVREDDAVDVAFGAEVRRIVLPNSKVTRL